MKQTVTINEYITLCFASIGKFIFDDNEYSLVNKLKCIKEEANTDIRKCYIALTAFLIFIIYCIENEIKHCNIQVLNEAKKVGKDYLNFTFSNNGLRNIVEKEWYGYLVEYKKGLNSLSSTATLEMKCKHLEMITIQNINKKYADDPFEFLLLHNVASLACETIKHVSKKMKY